MAKREYIQRHLLIIKRLKHRPSSFEELHDYLIQQQSYTDDNYDISLRTFQRDVRDIYSIYGVEIKYNKSTGRYEVLDEEEPLTHDRLFESFEILTALNASQHIGNKILLQRKANQGTEHLHGLLYALQNDVLVSFTHQSYWKDAPTRRFVQPLVIKEAHHRWYLVCLDVEKEELRNFGLDRIRDLEITTRKAGLPAPDFSRYYQHAVGVETYKPAERVVLECTPYQAQYLKSLPIHHSQRLVEETPEYCRFELFVHPTNEFEMEVFQYNASLVVLEPQWLREKMADTVRRMMEGYS